tara:strand:+ start:33662 stop:33775 length:114 start_codon:yes stop_codon:yes gene_type:complete
MGRVSKECFCDRQWWQQAAMISAIFYGVATSNYTLGA